MTDGSDLFLYEADVPPVELPAGQLALDTFLTALVDEAQAAAQTPLDPPLDAAVIQHLQKMGDLASQLRAEVDQITAIDSTALDRLKQQQQAASSA